MAENERIQPRPLTIGHIAVEIGCDRRTVARALREAGVEPVSDLNGHPCWTIAQTIAALDQRAKGSRDGRLRRFQRPPAELPSWLQAIDDLCATDSERGFALGLMVAIYHAPRIIGGMAAQAGATMGQAFETSTTATLGMVHVLFEDAKKAGIGPFSRAGR